MSESDAKDRTPHGAAAFALFFAALAAGVYYYSNSEPLAVFNQTFVVARAMLHGRLGVEGPRPWLEFVPGEELHYSVFPLGAVLTMLPAALLAETGWLAGFPSSGAVAVCAFLTAYFAVQIGMYFTQSFLHGAAAAVFLLYGSWLWCNLVSGSAWQLALGFSVAGQLGALYYILVRRAPAAAGCCFALAYGNRTELILLAPFYLYLLLPLGEPLPAAVRANLRPLLEFLAVPVLLLLLTLGYNQLRFYSPFDMGYDRIPYVYDDPDFEGGLFSLHAVRSNFRTMVRTPFAPYRDFPYFRPTGFGESIFLCSPYLLLLFRKGAAPLRVRVVSWAAVLLLIAVLFFHGNAGAMQYGYRYGIDFLPWLFLLLTARPKRLGAAVQSVLLGISVGLSAYAVWAFYWGRIVF